MGTTLVTPVEVDQTARIRGGLLDVALPAPDGWERGGLAISFVGCRAPDVVDKCAVGVAPAGRPSTGTFSPFPIEQGDICSTVSGLDHEANVLARLEATTEWALGRQLATDQANTGSPSLADAILLGTCDDVVAAVGALEQAAADTGFGAAVVLHTSIRGAAFMRACDMLDENRLSPAGSPWITSSGYPNPAADTIRIWATGLVWAGVDEPDVFPARDWQRNSAEALALRAGIVGFDPCINLAVDVVVGDCLTA